MNRCVFLLGFLSLIFMLHGVNAKTKSGDKPRKGTSRENVEQLIDEFVEGVMECYEVPGMNLAVVRDGEVFMTKGYGVRNLQSQEPMTSKTIVVLASITKSFVATLMAKTLQDNPQFNWDSTIREVLGDWFYFSDPVRTSRATIRDLLSHRMGMPLNNPMRIYYTDLHELVSRLQYLEFSEEWRDVATYNNLMYGLATYIIQELNGGVNWEDVARDQFFKPMGMNDTVFVNSDLDRWPEFATSYNLDDGVLREMSLEDPKAWYIPCSAAGAISSTAEDMARYIQFQLNEGTTPDGEEIITPALWRDTHSPAMVSRALPVYRKPNYPITWSSEKYALGWMEGYYREYPTTNHGGSRSGYNSLMTFVSDLQHGVYSTINRPGGSVNDLVHMYALDLLMGEEPWLDVESACDMVHYDKSKAKPNKQSSPTKQNHKETRIKRETDRHKSSHGSTGQKEHILSQLKASAIKQQTKSRTHHRSITSFQQTKYIGTYGNFAYGNLTVYLNETTDFLNLKYGPDAVFELHEGSEDSGVFTGYGQDFFWYWELTVRFPDNQQEPIEEVIVYFDWTIPPTFERDLNMEDAPEPQPPCP